MKRSPFTGLPVFSGFADSIFRWTTANRESDSLGYYMGEYAGQTHCKLFPMTLVLLRVKAFRAECHMEIMATERKIDLNCAEVDTEYINRDSY